MKKIILIRHAKSAHEFGVRDYNRPITDSGKADARAVAEAAAAELNANAAIWSSPARRAVETAVVFRQSGAFPAFETVEDLYTFNCSELQEVVTSCPDNIQTLIIFGHNEAITDFVNKFGDIYIDNVPTSGLVPITFESDSWKTISAGKTGRCVFPKLLRK